MSTALEDLDQLIGALRSWGIAYLTGGEASGAPTGGATPQAARVAFIRRLALCVYPRVRDASISLFLLHPELAPAVLAALQTSERTVTDQLAVMTLATLYLQRLWNTRLTQAFGHPPGFPEGPFAYLWRSRHFPPPASHDGKWGLFLLQRAEQERRGAPLHFLGDWQNQIDHLLLQEEGRRSGSVPLLPSLRRKDSAIEEVGNMTSRPDVDKARIERFLTNLGQAVRSSGRLYLVGGADLVHLGIRAGSTLDIDVVVEAGNEDEIVAAIRALKDSMPINVEFASPGDFIPLPAQWAAQARYVGRYGPLDVFYFDFYSSALSKILRGNELDIKDVLLLIEHQVITLDELDAAYQEIVPRVGKTPYAKLDPRLFAARYAAVRQLLPG